MNQGKKIKYSIKKLYYLKKITYFYSLFFFSFVIQKKSYNFRFFYQVLNAALIHFVLYIQKTFFNHQLILLDKSEKYFEFLPIFSVSGNILFFHFTT